MKHKNKEKKESCCVNKNVCSVECTQKNEEENSEFKCDCGCGGCC